MCEAQASSGEYIRYVSSNAKWYIDNINHIRQVMRYDHFWGWRYGPVELLDWNGELVVAWFPATYTFEFINTPSVSEWLPFRVTYQNPAETQLKFEANLQLDYSAYGNEPKTYKAYLATESKVQEYLQEYGFCLPDLPPSNAERTEFEKIRNASKYLEAKLDSDSSFFLADKNTSQNVETMAHSYSDFAAIEQALNFLARYQTLGDFLDAVNAYLWYINF